VDESVVDDLCISSKSASKIAISAIQITFVPIYFSPTGNSYEIDVFWDVIPCSLMWVYWRFGATCCLQLQCRKLILRVFSCTFLRNVCKFYHTTQHHIPKNCSLRTHSHNNIIVHNSKRPSPMWLFQFSGRNKEERGMYSFIPWHSCLCKRAKELCGARLQTIDVPISSEFKSVLRYTLAGCDGEISGWGWLHTKHGDGWKSLQSKGLFDLCCITSRYLQDNVLLIVRTARHAHFWTCFTH
jgi:hypothetical protein